MELMESEQTQKGQRCRGTVLSIVGGLYEIYCPENEPHIVPARARGAFRHEGMRPRSKAEKNIRQVLRDGAPV